MKKLDLDEYKEIVLNILIRIDMICRENSINYFLVAGTLLGAVRHRGFIPWDDDIDIAVMREDYNRLAQIIRKGNYGLNFIRIEENPDTIYPYGKICDINTVLYEKNFRHVKGYGAFVDVFPLDNLPDDEKKRQRLRMHYFRLYQLATHSTRTGYIKTNSTVANIKKAFAFYFSKLFNSSKLITKMNNDSISINKNVSNTVGVLWSLSYPKEEFMESSEVWFEGHLFLAPKDPDWILKKMYGDYMKLPPESARIPKHTLDCFLIDSAEIHSGGTV